MERVGQMSMVATELCSIQWGSRMMMIDECAFKHHRWLSSVEKFTAMGWPTTKELAKILGRPVVFPRMCNAHERIGNGMHVFNCVALLLAVLGSIEIMEPVPQKACVFCFFGVVSGWCMPHQQLDNVLVVETDLTPGPTPGPWKAIGGSSHAAGKSEEEAAYPANI